MQTPRFSNDSRPVLAPRFNSRKNRPAKWIRISQISDPARRDVTHPEHKKIYAVVAPPKKSRRGKTIQRILIFDNHPGTVRLISRRRPGPDVDLAALRRSHRCYAALALCLILILVLTTVWLI
jgi:hypothetical protein